MAPGPFNGDWESQTAVFDFAFDGAPIVESIDGGVMVSLEGEETWVSTGDPVMPVRESTILLPQGMQIASVSASYIDGGVVVASEVNLLAAPAAVPFDESSGSFDGSIAFVSASFDGQDVVEYSNHTIRGYNVGTLRVFPIEYDAIADTLTYHSRVSVTVTVTAMDGDGIVSARYSETDRQRVAELVDNPEAIDGYTTPAPTSAGDSPMLPADGQYEYVIITNSALASGFQPLVSQKQSRGLSAGIVTTEYIYANYSGTETGDGADKIRSFIADAYANWGTQWVLLGGDAEVVPQRGVYASVGSTVDYNLPTDLYYACLDGPWNGDGDSLWGESNDGAGGGDIDLMSEVYIGRAPVSSLAETANFVSKTVQYETAAHPNATTAVWLGEQLDSQTWGSYSSIPIADRSVPDDWTLIERYDSAGGWSAADFYADLNASPNLVNHLGHANETYNARLYNSNVAALSNDFPYFMYSQGCMSGSFDTHDLAIAEHHVVAENGALGVIMNSRYGWYVPGNTPGASHYYALEFWDAVFNEGLTSPGQANQDSKDDNMFRVGSTGVYRWISFETNLLGDPETPLQTDGDAGGNGAQISGIVWDDVNGDGQQQAGEQALAGQAVFLDMNLNGVFDSGTVTTAANNLPAGIPDDAAATFTLTVDDGATIADLNVTLDITHTYDSDLEAYLISPSGTMVELFSGVGGWGANFTDTTLDDEAATSITAANAPFTGTFRPEGLLSRFDGEDPTGTWTLQIADTMAWDVGTLNSWSLEITGEEPQVYSDTDGSYAFTGLAGGTYSVRHELSSGWVHTNPVDGALLVSVQPGETVQDADFLASEASQVPPATELGPVDFLEVTGLNLTNGDHWYSLQTTRQGYLTVQALFEGSGGELEMKLYDATLNELAVSAASGGWGRIDWDSGAGETFYLQVAGNASDADLRLANLVHHHDDNLAVYGTQADDGFEFAAAALYRVTINGVQYEFQPASLTSVEFDGGAGDDSAVLFGSGGEDTAVLHPSWATLAGPGYRVAVTDANDVITVGQGGQDVAYMYDSAGDDVFVATPGYGKLYGEGFFNRAVSFGKVHALATAGGDDVAVLYDSAGDDVFIATPDYGKLYGEGFFNRAVSFGRVHALANAGGSDVAGLYDSAGDDVFIATPDYGKLYGEGFFNRAVSFGKVHALATAGGHDVAWLTDSAGDDVFVATPECGKLYGDGFFNQAVSFSEVRAFATAGGTDVAWLADSAGDDSFIATPDFARLYGEGFSNRAVSFSDVRAFATAGGTDAAWLYDSPGDDVFVATPNRGRLYGDGFSNLAVSFSDVRAFAIAGGTDVASLYDSAGDDLFVGTPSYGRLFRDGFSNLAVSFSDVRAFAIAGGTDVARLYDSAGDDVFVGTRDYGRLYGDGFSNLAVSFRHVRAYADSGGYDRADLYDSAGDDHLEAAAAVASLSADDFFRWAYDFAWVRAISSEGGTDTKHVESVDYVLQTEGPWIDV